MSKSAASSIPLKLESTVLFGIARDFVDIL